VPNRIREVAGRAFAAAPCFLIALLGSCGSVGEPLPPLLNIPGPVEELRASQIVDQIILSWNRPAATTEGRPLKPLRQYTIRAMVMDPGAPTPSNETFDHMSRDVATRDPEPDSQTPLTVILDGEPFLGRRAVFDVQVVGENGRVSPHPPFAVVEVVEPPSAPSDVKAEAEADGVRVRWGVVAGAARYRIMRRELGPDAGNEPVISESETAETLDRSIRWGQSYEYSVLALVEPPTGPVPGLASVVVEITPADRFAPAPPRDLRAVASSDGVELSWSASPEADLAGYRVLRDGRAIHEGLVTDPAFSDGDVTAGATYRYAVEAEDQSGNSGMPSEAVEATIR